MEPRGSIGVYQPYDGRYTIYTTLQRTFPFREDLAKTVLRVSENKVRVMVEGPDEGRIKRVAEELKNVLREEIG